MFHYFSLFYNKTKFLCFVLLAFNVPISLFSQIGINTNTPKASLDIIGKPTETSVPDGVIVPRISRSDLISKTAYSTDQQGALIFVTDLSGTLSSATSNVTSIGFYYFDGTAWQKVSASNTEIGDIKQAIRSTDHSGWVLLDGRAINTLSTTQQSSASALGFSGNLPDASDLVLMQNGANLGTVSGSNLKTIARNNLPNVTLSGTTNADGIHSHSGTATSNGSHTHTGTTNSDAHTHTITGYNTGVGATGIPMNSNVSTSSVNKTSSSDSHTHGFTTNSGGAHTHTLSINNSSDHTHTFTTSSINGGVTQVGLDITPKTLSVNFFIFLGN